MSKKPKQSDKRDVLQYKRNVPQFVAFDAVVGDDPVAGGTVEGALEKIGGSLANDDEGYVADVYEYVGTWVFLEQTTKWNMKRIK